MMMFMVTICAWCSSLLPTAKRTSSCGEMQHDPLLSRSNPYYSASRFKFYAYNKSLCKWGHFEKAKTTFKMLLATWFFVCFLKRFRSFVAENLEFVGQRATKLPAIKLWEWFEGVGVRTRAHWLTGAGASWQTFLRPPTLTTSNFAAL